MIPFRSCWLLFLLLLPGCAVHGQEAHLEPLTIETSAGEVVHYRVEVARSQRKRARGLMYRESLPEDRGMLFIYRPDRVATMWMKNTLVSLDMLFMDSGGRVVKIESGTEPGSTRIISAGEKVRAVLELNSGQALQHNIRPGDLVVYPEFD